MVRQVAQSAHQRHSEAHILANWGVDRWCPDTHRQSHSMAFLAHRGGGEAAKRPQGRVGADTDISRQNEVGQHRLAFLRWWEAKKRLIRYKRP